MDRDFVIAQAQQDQQWMELDDWYRNKADKEALEKIVRRLDLEPTESNLKAIRKLGIRELEIIRCLVLHVIRDLMLREQVSNESQDQEEEDNATN